MTDVSIQTDAGMDADAGPPACSVPLAPMLTVIDDSETLTFVTASGLPIEVAALAPTEPLSSAVFAATAELVLAGFDGPTRVLARTRHASCAPALFDSVYQVEGTYPPHPPSPASRAIAAGDARFTAWATGLDEVSFGPGSATPVFMMPSSAFGPGQGSGNSVVSLGNGGRITLTFAAPITNGEGDDFAVFENAFAAGYFELAFVEVSSDGEEFVRFDSASRFDGPPCGACAPSPTEMSGIAGSYMGGFGTPFDLEALANHPAVRHGSVDLAEIRYVRIVDIVGDGTTLDSFGRPIYDPLSHGPNAGFDLDAIGVLHERTP